jgi:uncharacterized protein (DUF2236 family)
VAAIRRHGYLLLVVRGEDRGYFPRGESVLRRVHGARVVGFTYGQRALLMQATHPLAFAGLMANTQGLEAPFKRLAHTAEVMEHVYFGSRAEADRTTEIVRRMHSKVRGRLREPAGPWPAGSSYAADDPQFLLWILIWLADSAEAAYVAFVRHLDPDERERFWQDYRTVGELFGLPREQSPADYGAYRAYVAERLAGDDLFVTERALEIGMKVAFDLPVPAVRRPALEAVNLAVLGLLPPRVRALYGLPWDGAREAAFRALCASLKLTARVTPGRIRRGSCVDDYQLVARTEAQRLARAA